LHYEEVTHADGLAELCEFILVDRTDEPNAAFGVDDDIIGMRQNLWLRITGAAASA
jgi:hypothetical protein